MNKIKIKICKQREKTEKKSETRLDDFQETTETTMPLGWREEQL